MSEFQRLQQYSLTVLRQTMPHKSAFATPLLNWHKPIETIAVSDQSENTALPWEIVWTAQTVALPPKMQAGKPPNLRAAAPSFPS